MSYNLKCCSFYPNNFDASALSLFDTPKGLCRLDGGRGCIRPRTSFGRGRPYRDKIGKMSFENLQTFTYRPLEWSELLKS